MDNAHFKYLDRCIELARLAVDAGDEPFGSMLVAEDGTVLFEDRNRAGSGDATRHPEIAAVRWALANMSADERRRTTVFTSGEHCAMCAAAHGLAGLGKIVYASSSRQLEQWSRELGKPTIGIRMLPITDVIDDADVEGPFPEFAETIRSLHARSRA